MEDDENEIRYIIYNRSQAQEPDNNGYDKNSQNIEGHVKTENIVETMDSQEIEDHVKTENIVERMDSQEIEEHVKTENIVERMDSREIVDHVQTENIVETMDSQEIEDHLKTENIVETINSQEIEDHVKVEYIVEQINSQEMEDHVKTENLVEKIGSQEIEDHVKTEKVVETIFTVQGFPKIRGVLAKDIHTVKSQPSTNVGIKIRNDDGHENNKNSQIIEDHVNTENIIFISQGFPKIQGALTKDTFTIKSQPSTSDTIKIRNGDGHENNNSQIIEDYVNTAKNVRTIFTANRKPKSRNTLTNINFNEEPQPSTSRAYRKLPIKRTSPPPRPTIARKSKTKAMRIIDVLTKRKRNMSTGPKPKRQISPRILRSDVTLKTSLTNVCPDCRDYHNMICRKKVRKADRKSRH